MTTLVKGTVRNIQYTADNAWRVLAIQTLSGDSIEAVGIHPNAVIGETLTMHGYWTDHASFARKFVFERLESAPPPNIESLASYLATQGDISLALAQKIVNKFGEKTLEILSNTPSKLKTIDGLTGATLQRFLDQWSSQQVVQHSNQLISGLGLSTADSQCLIDRIGGGQETAYHKIKHNPYLVYLMIPERISFFDVDRKALDDQISRTALTRIQAGVVYTLQRASLNGHTYLPLSLLPHYLKKYLGLLDDDIDDIIQTALTTLHNDTYIVVDASRVFLPDLRDTEYQLAAQLKRLTGVDQDFELPTSENMSRLLADVNNSTIDESEIAVIQEILVQKASMVHMPQWRPPDAIVLGIYTILTELMMSVTIVCTHNEVRQRLLTLVPNANLVLLDNNNFSLDSLLTASLLHASVVVVCNAEQINLLQFTEVLKHTPDSSTLVLLGDLEAQGRLGPGHVFQVLSECKTFPHILPAWETKGHTPIHAISMLRQLSRTELDTESLEDIKQPLSLIRCTTISKMHEIVLHLIGKGVKRFGADDDQDFVVLTPSRHSELGSNVLNSEISRHVVSNKETFKLGKLSLRQDERVIITNDLPGLPEGSVGYVKSIEKNRTLRLDSVAGTKTVLRRDLRHVEPAYVVPVFQALNMRVSIVFLCVPEIQSFLAHQRLFYSAACIAKKKLIILSTKKIFFKSINKVIKASYQQLPDLLEHLDDHAAE